MGLRSVKAAENAIQVLQMTVDLGAVDRLLGIHGMAEATVVP